MIESIYLDNDNLLTVDSVSDATDGMYINDATVTCTLTDTEDNEVTGQAWPLALSYVSGSNGKYQGLLEDSLVLTKDVKYLAKITIDGGSDLIANFRKPLFASYRR